jgi:hypothetical protein
MIANKVTDFVKYMHMLQQDVIMVKLRIYAPNLGFISVGKARKQEDGKSNKMLFYN